MRNAVTGAAERIEGQFLAVNLTATLLTDPAVMAVLEAPDCPPGLVVEPVWPADSLADGEPGAVLVGLRERGVLLGCGVREGGRSDLERVQRWQPDVITLDTSLVVGSHADPVRDRVIRSIVQVAEDLGAVLLAEGLEGLDDARHLQRVGVRLAQGWLVGRPRPSLTPPSPQVCTWLQATWQETVAQTRLGRLVNPLPGAAERPAGAAWAAELDGEGELVALVDAGGARLPAGQLMRLRASQDLRSAAVRVLASPGDRRGGNPLVVADDEGRFLGVVDGEDILREVLATPTGPRPHGR